MSGEPEITLFRKSRVLTMTSNLPEVSLQHPLFHKAFASLQADLVDQVPTATSHSHRLPQYPKTETSVISVLTRFP